MKQQQLLKINWTHHASHGGMLRKKRAGRKYRPLNSKRPLHVVFKADRQALKTFKILSLRSPRVLTLIQQLVSCYSKKFFIKVEQISIQGDHIHLLIRASTRGSFQSFFKVLAGQIAQRVTDTYGAANDGPKIWFYRPFSRVIEGWKPYLLVKDYIQLNEKEALGQIPYRKERLRGLSPWDWGILWG